MKYFLTSSLLFLASVFVFQELHAAQPSLAFKPAGKGLYDFNTGKLKGRLKLDGSRQGVATVVDVESGQVLTNVVGVFSYYRIFSTNRRYGDGARDWPTTSRLLPDGAIEVHWPAAEEHPLEITAVYRWSAPDTLDLQTTVKPQRAMPDFEMFLSSYFSDSFRAAVYMKPANDAKGKPAFQAADPGPQSKSGYAMFPLNAAVEKMILDGRWKFPPSPVDWDIERWLAAPLAIRRDQSTGITAAMMARPQDCFAISCRWNLKQNESGYRSLYMSLFGHDLKADQTATVNCRLVIGKGLSDTEVVRRYKEYMKQ
ncbi:MAG: hypothetical protein JXM70_13050 [Pirellulales bacterium]|nr:hypothetical protein [Pirellulales bacterium]